MLKGILFDLDGTLVDSLSLSFDAFNHGITLHGGRRHTPEEIMKHFGQGEREIFAHLIGPENAQSAYDACRTYLNDNMLKMPLHPGVSELLDNLKSDGCPISIVTGRSWPMTELILKHHRILDRFVTVVADDHVDSPKPSPFGIRLALSRMKLDPQDTLYVGDSWMDIRAARSAGATSVAALWDLLANREALAVHDPHHWADHPREIWELWQERG